ncbi:MAG TPA: hypothetical protein VJ987_11810 [Anaerolineales bacterium]|nr:hypothetical protein [Anaerolineales bacterium]
MTTPVIKEVSRLSKDIKKLIAATEPKLLINKKLSNSIIENALDNSFTKEPYDDSPPWPGEWDNWEPGDDD